MRAAIFFRLALCSTRWPRGNCSFAAILNRAPVPAVRLNPDLPAKLEDIIGRALEKDRDLRYQHASEMRSELMRVKRDTESGRSLSVSAFSPVSGSTSVAQETSARSAAQPAASSGSSARSAS